MMATSVAAYPTVSRCEPTRVRYLVAFATGLGFAHAPTSERSATVSGPNVNTGFGEVRLEFANQAGFYANRGIARKPAVRVNRNA